MAPSLLGSGSAVYTEEDFEAAYTGKRCDIGVDFGHMILLVEVVSGQITLPTRVEGSRTKLLEDTEKLVIKKCRQLDETANAILDDQEALPDHVPFEGLRIVPLVVTAEGYPLNPFTADIIRSLIRDEGLFNNPMIDPVSIIRVAELDALEGLVEGGMSVIDLLADWRNSSLADLSLSTFLSTKPETSRIVRSPHIDDAARQVLDQMIPRLKLREPDEEPAVEPDEAPESS